jgi:hypothetical protein
MAGQEAPKIEAEGKGILGPEVMFRLLRRKKRGNYKPIGAYPVGNAEGDHGVGDDAAAARRYPQRSKGFELSPAFQAGGNKDKITKWCKDYFDALHPYSTRRAAPT